MMIFPGRQSSSFRSTSDRFRDVSSYRKGRCRRENNDYRDLGPGKYDRHSMMELQQSRPKTMGSILGGSSRHRSTVTRRGTNWYPGWKECPHPGPGTYHQASRLFLGKEEAVMFLPGSRKGFHSFLNSGRSKKLMGDAVLFQTARSAGQHLGPGSYDLPSTLTNGIRPSTAPEPRAQRRRTPSLRPEGPPMGHQRGLQGAHYQAANPWRGGRQSLQEKIVDIQAVRALPALR